MKLADFDYYLPAQLIAQRPAEKREEARLMVVNRQNGSISHERFFHITRYLKPVDALVLNDTKVSPSRLTGRRADTGGRVDILLTSETVEGQWEALIRPHKRGILGRPIIFGGGALRGEVLELKDDGKCTILLKGEGPVREKLLSLGRTPLPPYIKRGLNENNMEAEMFDRKRYQTVYAREKGSLAAPTAGLHFSTELLQKLSGRNIRVVTITLHISAGTFRPIRQEGIHSHRMEPEHFCISKDAAEEINRARASGGKVVAVGSTTTRALESCSGADGKIEHRIGWSSLFIYPGYKFKAVDALVTNFHLPRSTPLLLACAFGGRELLLEAYEEAIKSGYRFYSFGDAMLIV